MAKGKWIGALLFCSAFLSGCTLFPKKHDPYQVDGPPLVERDVSKIPDARPKVEPFSKYGNPRSYEVFGQKYHVMASNKDYQAKGIASWYGRKFHGKRTSSGEPYDMFAMTAAHKTLPIPTYAKVKNLKNGKEIIVKINDRGPFADDRILDLSYAAAKKLGVYDSGTAMVQVTAIDAHSFYKKSSSTVASSATNKASTTAISTAAASSTPSKTTTAVASASSSSSGAQKPVYIQLGAFKSKENADKLAAQANQITNKWEQVMISVLSPITNSPLYKVRVGPIVDLELAENVKNELAQLSLSKLVFE
ncbi:septal ring lytic transglycosylase RlpA family protein [Candidatus Berkiella cookevillensis]|uniref:Endolytic peptidoglycan transglycosylase RlpA n=1 Tax=Candidatus Berkiella cookevillensis TaxID=437022 RepID=A0A0Q9YPT6_9GAMM|nr:septal ring lytic transglycosylase RlpA family protein [Candidatus Berkiella cookevillensis]MCS5707871.1 septal ring lytic transglycosylase RlpA family protein [Candidatus Berkiella cookevillensis]